ncbi:hypothetical protein IBX65_08925 [Candidatus Aerophobetes bacterium]|nr:hypothetical protein [Candidatus Aerophobetes bacterium]
MNYFGNMAHEHNIAFVCLSQLSRNAEERTPPIPILSDLRESGDIEQSADVVILLWYPYRYDQTKPQNELFVNVAKNRDGACGAFKLLFSPEHYRLED